MVMDAETRSAMIFLLGWRPRRKPLAAARRGAIFEEKAGGGERRRPPRFRRLRARPAARPASCPWASRVPEARSPRRDRSARGRSEERRVGKEWLSTGRSRWSAYH